MSRCGGLHRGVPNVPKISDRLRGCAAADPTGRRFELVVVDAMHAVGFPAEKTAEM